MLSVLSRYKKFLISTIIGNYTIISSSVLPVFIDGQVKS